jgi:uncharacterized protein involved in response to NO
MRSSLFAYGFRPFFLLTGLAAAVFVPLWASAFVFGTGLGSAWPPTLWHGHEMLYGVICSAVAGFLLTAVPSWTGKKGFSGWPLLSLALLWTAGRLAIATSALWPDWWVAVVDLAFLPLLAMLISVPLVRARNRNTVMLVLLGCLWVPNLIFHVALHHQNAPLAAHAVRAGIDVLLILVTLIGGRIIPAFTSSGLRSRGIQPDIRSSGLLTALAVAAMILVAIADIVAENSRVSAAVSAAAALIQTARMQQWATPHALKQSIIWVLHLAYFWLPVGLALKALALFGGFAVAAFWLHALTIGTLVTMIFGVMTRASLGHTGRPLVIKPMVTAAYALLTVAAMLRVFGLALHLRYPLVIVLAAASWTAAFVIFLLEYAPILVQARVDGKSG